MDLNLSSFTPEQIAALKSQLDGLASTGGRSPFRDRQLHNLTLLPTKDDPRPTFFWSAEPPRHAVDLTRTTTYPRLMWEMSTGREVTVQDVTAEASYTAQGFTLTAPANAEAPDALAVLKAQLEMLSPEDRAVLVAAAQKDRLASIQAQIAGLSEAELESLTESMVPSMKRGPGRPKKEAVA